MALKKIHIENFKSIGEIDIVDPQPFSVVVGPNAAGKSNIFAALQFLHHLSKTNAEVVTSGFGGIDQLLNYKRMFSRKWIFVGEFEFTDGKSASIRMYYDQPQSVGEKDFVHRFAKNDNYDKIVTRFSRVFVNKSSIVFQKIDDDSKLAPDASNLEKVLKRIINDPEIKDEFIETLQLFIPGLERVDVVSSEFSSNLDLLVYEKALNRPINKDLISDGTYNIIAILTALYQSKMPQFLCIEEPENGLNPQVLKELVEICRYLCEQHGHYIWLNTHSQSLVSQLKPEEIILVDKVEGFTKIKQFKKGSFEGIPMDEAWLTNTLGGGLPW